MNKETTKKYVDVGLRLTRVGISQNRLASVLAKFLALPKSRCRCCYTRDSQKEYQRSDCFDDLHVVGLFHKVVVVL